MRRNQLLTLMLLLMFVINTSAQHRLTKERNALRGSDRLIKQQVEFKDPGSMGKSLQWDFRMLQPLNEEYTLDYFIPDSTRMDTLCGMEHLTRYYYKLSNDSIWAIGFENSTTIMDYQIPELRLRFPFGYGDTLRSCFEGSGEYSHMFTLRVKGYTRVVVDAEGELLLPDFETVKRALRVHTQRYYTETGRDSIEMCLDTWAWYAEGIRYPVFESVKTNLKKRTINLQSNRDDAIIDTTVFQTSFYYPPELQISQVETEPIPESSEVTIGAEAVFTEATMLPNPVISNLHIDYKLTRPAKIWFTIHNNAGIPVKQTTVQNMPEGYNHSSISMNNIMPGTYTVYVHVDDMVLQKIIIKQ